MGNTKRVLTIVAAGSLLALGPAGAASATNHQGASPDPGVAAIVDSVMSGLAAIVGSAPTPDAEAARPVDTAVVETNRTLQAGVGETNMTLRSVSADIFGGDGEG